MDQGELETEPDPTEVLNCTRCKIPPKQTKVRSGVQGGPGGYTLDGWSVSCPRCRSHFTEFEDHDPTNYKNKARKDWNKLQQEDEE